jgi:hypothetical protein
MGRLVDLVLDRDAGIMNLSHNFGSLSASTKRFHHLFELYQIYGQGA